MKIMKSTYCLILILKVGSIEIESNPFHFVGTAQHQNLGRRRRRLPRERDPRQRC